MTTRLAARAEPAAPGGAWRDRCRAAWAAWSEHPRGRRVRGSLAVAVLAAAVQLAAAGYFNADHSTLFIADAQSHLSIARRILDSQAPGLRQLGTVWLPAPHLLLMPFVQPFPLFASGWAGSLLGVACMAATATAIFRTMAHLGFGGWGRVVALTVFVGNPSVLYTYSTALTEPVLMTGMAGAFAGLAHWARAERPTSGGELAVFAGVPTAVAVLSRYEGWALVLGGALFVVLVGTLRRRPWRRTLRLTGAFLAVPGLAVAWWIAYNWAIYHDPFEFMVGEYSAAAQQSIITRQGLVTTKGNLGLTLSTYNWDLVETAGAVALTGAVCGAAVALWREGLSSRSLLLGLTWVSYAFSLFSLYAGQTVVYNDHSLPPGWWNTRFALSVMVPVALCCGYLADRLGPVARRGLPRVAAVPAVVLATVLPLALVGQALWWSGDPWHRSAVLNEAKLWELSTADVTNAAVWLRSHHDGGPVLVDESANPVLVRMGIPLRQVVDRASGALFTRALRDPAGHAEWVLMRLSGQGADATDVGRDLVTRAMLRDGQFPSRFRLVHRSGDFGVYQRIEAAS